MNKLLTDAEMRQWTKAAWNEAVEQQLIASGYRKCAVGQRTTQWCAGAEKARERDEALLKQALEALLTYEQYMQPLTDIFGGPRVPEAGSASAKVDAAITALRERLGEKE